MRNVKLLWGTIIFLLVVTVGLGGTVARLLGTPRTEGETVKQGETQPPTQSAQPGNRTLASIGSRQIKQSDLNEALLSRHGAELLNQLIDREVIQQEADSLNLKLIREEIDLELKRMRQGYESEEQFYKAMKEQVGLSKEELNEDVYYKLLLEKIATKGIDITDKEVDAYMKAHAEEFGSAAQVRFQQIISSSLDQANKTIELAKGGRDFAELAKERSLDKATANDGGDMGWVDENDPFVPAAIMKALGAMKPGEISKPTEITSGYAVVKLNDRKERSSADMAEIRENVRKQLALQKAKPLKAFMEELRSKRHVTILDDSLRK